MLWKNEDSVEEWSNDLVLINWIKSTMNIECKYSKGN